MTIIYLASIDNLEIVSVILFLSQSNPSSLVHPSVEDCELCDQTISYPSVT